VLDTAAPENDADNAHNACPVSVAASCNRGPGFVDGAFRPPVGVTVIWCLCADRWSRLPGADRLAL